jgi:membrane protein DedA with SNARE-associated domain
MYPVDAMVQQAIASLSYAGLLIVLLLGSLGLPVPEEVPIVTAGILSHQGVMRWWLALASCIVGVMTGDIILYWLGRRWGERALERPLIRRLVDRQRLAQIEAAYRRRGALIVFLARHVMGLRAVAFVGAGIVGLPFWKFMLADGLAIAYGIPLNFTIAYLFTQHLHGILAEIHRVERWLALAALLGGAIWLYVALRRRSRRLLLSHAQSS